jgi:hypothetical protein
MNHQPECDVADHDQPYTWGRLPSTYLAPREIARLMLVRCRLQERQMLRNRGTVHSDSAATSSHS